jgi:hypothetical protein
MEKKIPTAEEICVKKHITNEYHISPSDCKLSMIEFAKLHVKAALEAAALSAKIIDDPNSYTGNTGSEYPPDQIVSEKSILTAYPESNIV